MPGVDQLAERLGKTRATIFNWLRLGKIPPPRGQVGNRKIWDPKEIEAWIAAGCPTVEEFERLLEDDE